MLTSIHIFNFFKIEINNKWDRLRRHTKKTPKNTELSTTIEPLSPFSQGKAYP